MAVANTTRVGTGYSSADQVVVPDSLKFVGRTLNHYWYTERVSSDHAWIDSGNRVRVTYLDENEMPRSKSFYTDDNDYVFENDATPEMMERARRVIQVVNGLQSVIHGYRNEERQNREVRQGDTVEVYKGRKAPKGRYEIVAMGNGNYGPYYNLRDASGKWYSYISVDNCRKVDVAPANVEASCPDEEAFIRALIVKLDDMATIGAYADWLTENGEEDGEILSQWVNAGCPQLPSIADLDHKS